MPTPPTNKGQERPPEPLTPDEIDRLLAAASNRSTSGIRLRAIVGVLYGAGLRVSECIALMPRDVDTASGSVRVRSGKGGKLRVVGIDAQGTALVDLWLARRAKIGLASRHPVFAVYERSDRVQFGSRVSDRYVRRALARLGDRAGIDKPVRPHGLRHSLAFRMARNGVPTSTIRDQLGHVDLAVTDRYIRRLHPAEVIDVMRDLPR